MIAGLARRYGLKCSENYNFAAETRNMPTMSSSDTLSRASYLRKIGGVCVLSVVAWAAFAGLFRVAYPVPSRPEDSLGIWWLWLAGGTVGFVVVTLAILRVFAIPDAWRTHAVLAFAAPALTCDIWTGTQTERWLPNAGPADDRLYLSFIVGGVGIIQLLTLVAEMPRRTGRSAGTSAPQGSAETRSPN